MSGARSWFGRALKRERGAGPRPHPLSAVPVPSPGVELREGAPGEWHVRRTLPAGSRLARWWTARTGMARSVHVVLDGNGITFWRWLDGERDLFALSKRIEKTFKLTESESRERVVRYTQMLMNRHLVQLRVPRTIAAGEPENEHG